MSVHHEPLAGSGAPGVTLRLRDGLRARGHAVELASFGDLPRAWSGVAKSLAFPLLMAARTARDARTLDVWDASTGDSWAWSCVGRRGPAVVVRSHGLEQVADVERRQNAAEGLMTLSRRYDLYWGGLNLRQVARSLRAADACLLLSDADAAYATSRLGVDAARVVVTFNGMDELFLDRPTAPRRDERAFRIACVATWLPGKGARYARDALVDVLRQRSSASATLLGVGVPAPTVLDDFPADLRARVRVVERYAPAELPGLLEGHHAGLSASVSEGFGIALTEMMACGLAAVAADAHGPATIITHGVDGVLTPRRDAASLARVLIGLMDDEGRRHALACAGQRRVRAFTVGRAVDRTLHAYERALGARRG